MIHDKYVGFRARVYDVVTHPKVRNAAEVAFVSGVILGTPLFRVYESLTGANPAPKKVKIKHDYTMPTRVHPKDL